MTEAKQEPSARPINLDDLRARAVTIEQRRDQLEGYL